MGDFMAEVVKIVLTGGPCGGKTSALKYISEELKKLNIPTITIGEVASRLFSEGKTPENVGSYEFHRELFEIQLAEENEKRKLPKIWIAKRRFCFLTEVCLTAEHMLRKMSLQSMQVSTI